MLRRWLLVGITAVILISLAGCGTSAHAQSGTSANGSSHSVTKEFGPNPRPHVEHGLATWRTLFRSGSGPHGSVMATGTKAVALTFDDGPSPVWTPRILRMLAKYHVHATFCLIGEQVKEYPKLVARIVKAGHSLCNHSWDHDEFMRSASARHIRTEMTRTLRAIGKASPGTPVRYFRQPGGNWSHAIVKQARALGMTPLHWSVDPSDWKRPPVHKIVHNVESFTQRGSIILMHDGGGDRSRTYRALKTLLPYLTRRYELIRL